MTIAMLMTNTVQAFKRRTGLGGAREPGRVRPA
jgi:hypothetical protein